MDTVDEADIFRDHSGKLVLKEAMGVPKLKRLPDGSTVELQRFISNFVSCVGCDIVQADHAPDGGVAQGIFHGILVRHHGRNQEEVEEGLEEEVERDKEEDNAQTTTCTFMDGMR